MSSSEKAFASVLPRNFGYNPDDIPRGITFNELLSSPAYIASFPSAFTYSPPASEILTESQMYRVLYNFITQNKKYKNLEQLLFPVFCVAIMNFKENSDYDQLRKYHSDFISTIPSDVRGKVDRFLSQDDVFNKYASLFSTQRLKVRVTEEEAFLINKFIAEPKNFQLRRRITEHVILELILDFQPTKETTVMFVPPDVTKDLAIYQTCIPNSTQAALSEMTPHIYAAFDGRQVYRFSTEDGSSDIIAKHSATVTSISVSSKGSMVVSTDIGGQFTLWTEQQQFCGSITRDAMLCSCFAPQGGVFCIGCTDNCTYMYDGSRVQKNRSFVGHRKPVTAVKFHPNCSLIGTTSIDATALLWDVRTAEPVRLFFDKNDLNTAKGTICPAFSPNGKYIAFYSTTVSVWDIGSDKTIAKRDPELSNVRALFFSEDSRTLFIVGVNGEVKLFEFLEEGAPIKDILSLSASVTSASINRKNEIHIITSAEIF